MFGVAMHKLKIHRLYFTNTDCYKTSPYQKQVGVQVHCTTSGNPYLKRYVQPDDGLLGKNKYGNSHNRPDISVCASAYIGKLDDGSVAVYQTLPWEKRCWLSGSGSKGNANRVGYIGFEVCCVLSDELYFREAVMDKAVKLVAYLCKEFELKPDDVTECGKAVMDHSELHRAGYASNHADITNWLKVYGLTMNDFRNEVNKVLEEGIEVNIVDSTPTTRTIIKKGDSGDDVKKLQDDLNWLGYPVEVDGIYGVLSVTAVKKFQNDHGLAIDGIVGPKTLKALEEAKEAIIKEAKKTTEEPLPTVTDGWVLVEEIKLDEAEKRLNELLELVKDLRK